MYETVFENKFTGICVLCRLGWEFVHVDSRILTCPVHIMHDAWCPIRTQDPEAQDTKNTARGVDLPTFYATD